MSITQNRDEIQKLVDENEDVEEVINAYGDHDNLGHTDTWADRVARHWRRNPDGQLKNVARLAGIDNMPQVIADWVAEAYTILNTKPARIKTPRS